MEYVGESVGESDEAVSVACTDAWLVSAVVCAGGATTGAALDASEVAGACTKIGLVTGAVALGVDVGVGVGVGVIIGLGSGAMLDEGGSTGVSGAANAGPANPTETPAANTAAAPRVRDLAAIERTLIDTLKLQEAVSALRICQGTHQA
ncbi:MAG: hypothetical protein HIU81_05495 [Acidobacteria bacterium]|nr:hypothetical protein [Acidobacteriota bacterium]